jgi:hypothetical protein
VRRFAWIAALGLGSGCAPTLTGALCATDCNCPQQQSCVLDGGHGVCADGPNNCGEDAGPALFGTFSLNGGIAKPAGNAAKVLVWDHNPIPDGGPAVQVTVSADGTWQISPSVLGQTYYLQGSYALNAGRIVNAGIVAQTADGRPVDVDVPTYQCTVWSELANPNMSAYLAGLVANVPNITDGTQSPTATVTATDGVQAVPFMFNLNPHPDDPFDNGEWAWGPVIPGLIQAHATYAFTINAPGYGPGTKCTVDNASLTQVPSQLNVPSQWNTTIAQTVTFIPPLGTQVSFIGILDGNSMRVTLGSSQYVEIPHATDGPTVSVPFPVGTLGNVCPTSGGGNQCTLTVISVRQTNVGPGVNEATSSATAAFNTTQN